jgi:hypothetical protein
MLWLYGVWSNMVKLGIKSLPFCLYVCAFNHCLDEGEASAYEDRHFLVVLLDFQVIHSIAVRK